MAEATQMIILPIPTRINLYDTASTEGKAWQQILDLLKSQPGFQRLYWGRQHEIPENAQIHIGIMSVMSYN